MSGDTVAMASPLGVSGVAPQRLREILAAGIRAPSAENRHYLRFAIGADSVVLNATDHAGWAAFPHRKWLALVSYGAVVENMALRASQFGYAQNVQWFPQPARPERIAEIGWATTSAAPDPLAEAIEARHTNRRFYRRTPVDGAALQRIAAAAAVPRAGLLWCDAERERQLALRALRLAETERFRRRELHGELFAPVRFECGWQRSSEEGLPPGALQVELPIRPAFAALRRWPLMRAACFAGVHLSLGLRAAWLPCALAPHIGLLLASGEAGDAGDVGSGRALQRAWLAAAAEGLAFQPFAAPVALRRQRPGGQWVSAVAQARLGQLLDDLTGPDARACMFFRLGHAAPPATVTERPPVDRYCA